MRYLETDPIHQQHLCLDLNTVAEQMSYLSNSTRANVIVLCALNTVVIIDIVVGMGELRLYAFVDVS